MIARRLYTYVLTLFCIHICLQQACSQIHKSIPGYYINTQGDTIKGVFTNYKNWTKNPQKVTFLESGSNTKKILTPDSISYFSISGSDVYKAYRGKRLINPIHLTDAFDESDSTDHYENVSVFLRLIYQKDNFTFWILNDNKRTNLFYELTYQPITELLYKSYNPGNSSIVDLSTYKSQLNDLFINRSIQKQLTDKLEYSEQALINYLEKIFKASKSEIKKEKNPAKFFIAGGISNNSLKVIGADGGPTYEEEMTNFKTNISPAITIGSFFYGQRNFGKFFISPRLSAYSFKNNGEYLLNNTAHTKYSFTFQTAICIKASANVGYIPLKTQNIDWHLMMGGGLAYLAKNRETINREDIYVINNYSKTSDIQSLTYNVNFETGILINKDFLIFVNYSIPAPITNNINFTGYHSSLQIMGGYVF